MSDSPRIINKRPKQSLSNKNRPQRNKQVNFGISFDVDGVLARGTIPIPHAVRGIKLLQDSKGDMRVPLSFVTNALNLNEDKAHQIATWLDIPVSTEQMIQAPGPLEMFKEYHHKFCLCIGQGKVFDVAKELGFTNMCSLEEVCDAYPLLDMVDHDNRKHIAKYGYTEKEFPRIEAIMFMGEPKRWESSLQVLVDILKTNGKPDHAPEVLPEKHMPVIACNMDLEFMDRACMPRYGHGAFLFCLESLYKKVTGYDLKYTAVMGKPSEVTMRFAEHCLARQAKKMGLNPGLKRMYMIGDGVQSDIVGANLYHRFITRLNQRKAENADTGSGDDSSGDDKDSIMYDPELPPSRNIPQGAELMPQTVKECIPILVCTGCYRPDPDGKTPDKEDKGEHFYHGHRDFPKNAELYKPFTILDNVEDALTLIMEREGFLNR